MSSTSALRKETDLKKLRELQSRIPKYLEILEVSGNPPKLIRLRIRIATAKNSNYPSEQQEISEVKIELPENYPFQVPVVNFLTPIWNPNVYSSGRWCFGDWKITENLELFVTRLMKVIALDPSIVNPASPANYDAGKWYVQIKNRQSNIFPTVSISNLVAEVEKPKITWKPIK